MNNDKVKNNLQECIGQIRKTQMLMIVCIFIVLPFAFILDAVLEVFFK